METNTAHDTPLLAGRLMHTQDDERRRIAQMLHETTAQEQLGGRLEIKSGDRGTTVRARLPLVKDAG
jgi:signal transduction histidine kinase